MSLFRFNQLRALVLIALTCSVFSAANAELKINEANFPDENLRAFIMEKFSNGDSILTDKQVQKVTKIECYGRSITDLTGIELFPKLNYLNCKHNQIARYDFYKCPNLETLICFSNKLSEFDVTKNSKLRFLQCQSNQITSLDITQNTALTYVDCSSNPINSIDVSKNQNLKSLYCNVNGLSELDIRANVNLTTLECHHNHLSEIDLTNNTELVRLYCHYNDFKKLDVTNNVKLQSFHCYNCKQLSDVDLTNNGDLGIFHCYGDPISALCFESCPYLKEVDCRNCKLSTLDFSMNPRIQHCRCSGNHLTELSFYESICTFGLQTAGNTGDEYCSLRTLDCSNNNLRTLFLSSCDSITSLKCNNNSLVAINLSTNVDLKDIDTGNNSRTIPVNFRYYENGEPIYYIDLESDQNNYEGIELENKLGEGFQIDHVIPSSWQGAVVSKAPNGGKILKLNGKPNKISYTYLTDYSGMTNSASTANFTLGLNYDNVTTDVSSIETDNIQIFAADGAIQMRNVSTTEIYNANGQRIYTGNDPSIHVAPGFYIVKANGNCFKVFVK